MKVIFHDDFYSVYTGDPAADVSAYWKEATTMRSSGIM